MSVKVVSIVPKRKFQGDAIQSGVNRQIRTFAREFQEEMAKYPPPRAWQSRTPKTGPRAEGQRTGQYGLGWQTPAKIFPQSVTIINPVPYATYVGGRRQRDYLKARGWRSVSDVGPEIAAKQLPPLRKLILPR